MRVPPRLQQVRYQPGIPGTSDAAIDRRSDYQIQLEPPGLERLSRLDSDVALQERIRQETLTHDQNERVTFPESPILSRERYKGRGKLWKPLQLTVEPDFTIYHRLFFEDQNSERYGWELGELQPLVSVGRFYLDVATAPLKLGNTLCVGWRDASNGHCLPGDPVPYELYPPVVTLPGTLTELGTIAALIAIFP
jgi:hypothetical protein